MPSNSRFITRLHPIYTWWFLYLEPVFAVGGTYLCIFQPLLFLRGTMPFTAYTALTSPPNYPQPPSTSTHNAISPVITMLLTNIGALYALFAINEGIVLRLSKEKSVWLTVVGAMLLSDVGHIYAVWKLDPERAMAVLRWTSDEWINYGTLIGGMILRLAFVIGIGRD